jgi:predicted Rossmann fold nucleotide-binding protein DprA/Smf involved in DNA uptake
MKKYYRQIIEGDVLVLSVFHPKSPWSVDLAMARNSIIYGLASEIYAAQSDDKGGTWSGVTDGLKKGRIVYVRMPEKNEKCANMTLINMGAEAVDMDGNLIHQKAEYELFGVESSVMAESAPSYNTLDERIVELLNNGEYTAKQIIEILHLSDYNSQRLSQRLSKLDGIQINKKGKTNKYSLQPQKQPEQLSLSL